MEVPVTVAFLPELVRFTKGPFYRVFYTFLETVRGKIPLRPYPRF